MSRIGIPISNAAMSTTTQPPKHKRRWYQFIPWTSFLVILSVAVACVVWIGWHEHQARVNRDRCKVAEEPIRRAVIEIEKSGGRVETTNRTQRDGLKLIFHDPGNPDEGGRTFIVYEVDFHNSKVTDAELKHLKTLTKLQVLDLSATKVTDAGLEHLKGLTKLETLRLGETNVTDEGVKKLQQALPNCTIYSD